MANEKTMKGNIEEFAVQMKRLVNNKEQSDIKFLIGSNRKPIYAHRCILANRCAVFKAMFQDQAQRAGVVDNTVPFVLADMTPDIFLAVMEFIYTNCVTLTPKIAIDSLGIGLEYGLEELRKLAGHYLIENLAVHNVCECLQASIVFAQNELKDACILYIDEHTEDVFKSKGFAELSEESLVETLKSDGLTMDESKILKYIRDWAQVNSVVLKKPYVEIGKKAVKQIRLTLFTPEEIEKIEVENRKEPFVPIECFSVAWKFHATKKSDSGNPLMRVRKGTDSREHHTHLLTEAPSA
ncbi:BTB/POZ domain-containing protein 19-like [Mytilus edulis]